MRRLGFFLVLAFANIAVAEVVTLKDGSIVRGSVVKMDESEVTIDTSTMGQINIKRYKIKSISEESSTNQSSQPISEAASGPINININNNQNNDQDATVKSTNTNENSLVSTATSIIENKDREKRTWKQGLFGRIGAGYLSRKVEFNNNKNVSIFDDLKGGVGVVWDIVGFRSSSWWGMSLFALGGIDEPIIYNGEEYDRSEFTGIVRFHVNFWKETHPSDALSQMFLTIGGGPSSVSVTNAKNSANKLIEAKGGGGILSIGYEYLISEHLGIFVELGSSGSTLKNFNISDAGKQNGLTDFLFSDVKLTTSSGFILGGLVYNFDM